MKIFLSDMELLDTALVLVARLTFEKAIPVISDGNVADESEATLSYLMELAQENNLPKKSVDSIAFYHRQILDENQEMLKYR